MKLEDISRYKLQKQYHSLDALRCSQHAYYEKGSSNRAYLCPSLSFRYSNYDHIPSDGLNSSRIIPASSGKSDSTSELTPGIARDPQLAAMQDHGDRSEGPCIRLIPYSHAISYHRSGSPD